MKVEQIVRNEESKVVRGGLPKGHLNGLLLSIKIKEGENLIDEIQSLHNARLRAKFVSDKTEHLITNLPLNAFIALSDIDFGSTANLSRLLNHGFAANDVPVVLQDEIEGESRQVAHVNFGIQKDAITLYVDLGSIYCEVGNEFHFELEGSTLDNFTTNAYVVSREIEPFHFLKYDIDFDLNENHQNIIRALIYTETVDKDATAYVNSNSFQAVCDLEGFRTATQIFGKIENVGAGLLLEVYRSIHGVPEDVWIKMTKNSGDALQSEDSSLGIMTVRVNLPVNKVESKNIDILKKQQELVRVFEKNYPEQSLAMTASGLLRSSESIQEKINELL